MTREAEGALGKKELRQAPSVASCQPSHRTLKDSSLGSAGPGHSGSSPRECH